MGFVDLAALIDHSLVVPTIASVLRLKESVAQPQHGDQRRHWAWTTLLSPLPYALRMCTVKVDGSRKRTLYDVWRLDLKFPEHKKERL